MASRVVDVVHRERGEDLEPYTDETGWRRWLMCLGHDPLPPAGDRRERR